MPEDVEGEEVVEEDAAVLLEGTGKPLIEWISPSNQAPVIMS